MTAVGSSVLPGGADAQLVMQVWKAAAGQVYQVLQYRAAEDAGVGVDELRVTSVAANSFATTLCGNTVPLPGETAAEALASGPLGGVRPLDLSVKSGLIGDASVPCFSPTAEDGLGAVCIGPDCDAACDCAEENECVRFTVGSGSPITTATDEVAAARFAGPLRVVQAYCDVVNELTFAFGGDGATLTSRRDICDDAPADGIRLPGSDSWFSNGTAGSTVVFVHEATPEETLHLAAAGFGIDTDGSNGAGCTAGGAVVTAVQASGAAVGAPQLTFEELRCEQTITRATSRFARRSQRALERCHNRIARGAWDIDAGDCLQQAAISRVVSAAARLARARIGTRCRQVAINRLDTCGGQVDDLFTPDYSGGCVFEASLRASEESAAVAYGF